MEKLLLTADEAADVLNLGKSTVYDLIRLRLLTSIKIGKRRLVPTDACRDMITRLIEEQQEVIL